MTLLIDTHVLLWFVWNGPRLSGPARLMVIDPTNVVKVSVASCWEIAIKAGTGKLQLGDSCSSFLARDRAANNLNLLPITFDYAAAVEFLPLHHRNPFDRLLAAQALVEGIPLVSADAAFDAYGVDRRWKTNQAAAVPQSAIGACPVMPAVCRPPSPPRGPRSTPDKSRG